MASRVFRYEVPVDDKVHLIRLKGDPTGVGLRESMVVEFWATSNDDVAEQERFFTVAGTGHKLPDKTNRVWGYAYDGVRTSDPNALVWHLVEVSG